MVVPELFKPPTDAEVNARLHMNLPAWWDTTEGGLDCYGGDNRKPSYGWAGSNKTTPDLFATEVGLVEHLCFILFMAELTGRTEDGRKAVKGTLKAHSWAKRAHLVFNYLSPLATLAVEVSKLQWPGTAGALAGYEGDITNTDAIRQSLHVETDMLAMSLWVYVNLWSHAVVANMGEWDSLPNTSPMLRVGFSAWLNSRINPATVMDVGFYECKVMATWKALRLQTAQGAHPTAYLHTLARWCEKTHESFVGMEAPAPVDMLPETGVFVMNLTDEQFATLRKQVPYQGRMSILRHRTNAQWPETIAQLRRNPRTRTAVDEWLALHGMTFNG